jgi:hypothetical protein
MKYVAPRKMTVVSTSGRSVEFEKGVATHCPPQMHAELIGQGIVPEEFPEEDDVVVKKVELSAAERADAIQAAYAAIAERNSRDDFTGTGAPHTKVVAKELGWDSFDAKERDATWAKFQADKAL